MRTEKRIYNGKPEKNDRKVYKSVKPLPEQMRETGKRKEMGEERMITMPCLRMLTRW
jgi:hypothetical protein